MSKILAASAVLLLSGAALLAEQDQAAQTKATAKLQLVQCAIRVYDMTCNSCAASVQKELLKVEGVKAVKDRKSTRLNLQSRPHLVCRLLLEKKKKDKA